MLEQLKMKMLRYISISSENKKSNVCRFILKCYEIMAEIEAKIVQEKQKLELLLEEQINQEFVVFNEEIKKSNI